MMKLMLNYKYNKNYITNYNKNNRDIKHSQKLNYNNYSNKNNNYRYNMINKMMFCNNNK